MQVRALFLTISLISVFAPLYAWQLAETPGYSFGLDVYSRVDGVVIKNVNDLDNRNSDDSTAYLGFDYSLGLLCTGKENKPTVFFKLERNGPYDYDAPLWAHKTLMPWGPMEKYHGAELLPQLEEFWADVPLAHQFGVKAGLYTFSVGNGFAVNGGYENYGASIYQNLEKVSWRLHYMKPDLINKYYWGPRIRQEAEQGIDYQTNNAHLYAADATVRWDTGSLQGYASALVDGTSAGKRDSILSAPVGKDMLGTFGAAWGQKIDDWNIKAEAAHNFGKSHSADDSYEDVYHTGYLVYTGVEYGASRLTPSLQLLVCSGNKVSLDDALSGATTLSGGRNRAFSYSSPANRNLQDAVSTNNTDMLPIVAMGGGYGLNYGISRPGTFSAGDFDNLIMPSLGMNYKFNECLNAGFYGYYLRSVERGVGVLDGEPKRLSADLGSEFDMIVDYEVRAGVMVSLLGGFFIPGNYYKELREDTSGSLLSPFVRGDGTPDPAYQLELVCELRF
jgi:hypothetical protein